MGASLLGGDLGEGGCVALAEGAARRRQHDVIDSLRPGRRVLRQALENGRVLAVDGHECRPALLDRLHEQRAPHDQRLFVGQQQPLACASRSQTRRQARGTHDGAHDDVHIGVRGHVAEGLRAIEHLGGQARLTHLLTQLRGQGDIGHHGEARSPAQTLVQQLGYPTRAGEGPDLEPPWVAGDDVQRVDTDRAGGAQDAHPLRASRESINHDTNS